MGLEARERIPEGKRVRKFGEGEEGGLEMEAAYDSDEAIFGLSSLPRELDFSPAWL